MVRFQDNLIFISMVTKEFSIEKNEQIRGVFKKDYIETCLGIEKPAPFYKCIEGSGKYNYSVAWESEDHWHKFLEHIQILGYITLEPN